MELVCQAMHRHRLEAGVAEDDLVDARGGRVAVVGRLGVGRQEPPDVGQGGSGTGWRGPDRARRSRPEPIPDRRPVPPATDSGRPAPN